MADPLNPTPQNPSGNTVVVYDPNGTPHDVPQEELHNAVSIGKGMPAVWMRGPNDDETMRRPIPADQVQDAVKAGGKILPFGQQDIQHPGFWATMSDDLDKPITIGGEVDRPLTHAKDLLVNMARNLGDVSVMGLGTNLYRQAKGEPGASQQLKETAAKATETFGPMMFGADVTPEERPPIQKPAPTTPPSDPEGSMLGRAAEVAKRRIQGLVPGLKTAKDIDYVLRGSPEAAPPTPKAPTPQVPPEWGQGRYGTPVSQWGKRIPSTPPPDPFSQSTQSIAPFNLAQAPTKAVLQAVDELGPKATQEQIATRVQQIVKEPVTPKSLQVPETPEATGEPVKGPLPKRFKPIKPEAPTPNQPIFDAKGNLTPEGKAVVNKPQAPEILKYEVGSDDNPLTEKSIKSLPKSADIPASAQHFTDNEFYDLPRKLGYTTYFDQANETAYLVKGNPVRNISSPKGPEYTSWDVLGQKPEQPGPEPVKTPPKVQSISEGTSKEYEDVGKVTDIKPSKSGKDMIVMKTPDGLESRMLLPKGHGYSVGDTIRGEKVPLSELNPEEINSTVPAKKPGEVIQMKPKGTQYPPEAPVTPVQPAKPTPEDVEETENIRQNVKQAAEREQRTAQRNIKGEYKQRNDVSTPKGTLTGAAGEGNDVSLRGGPTTPPIVTQLPNIANPQQAMRQLENLQAAGASLQAIQEFEGRAATRFGDNWKHVASQHDNLTNIVQDSVEKANTDRVYAAIQEAEPTGNSISTDRLSQHPSLQGMSKADIEAAALKLSKAGKIHWEESGGGPHAKVNTVALIKR